MITEVDVSRAFAKLTDIYWPPKNEEATKRIWMNVLKEVDPADFALAVHAYLQSPETKFPKPGQILRLIQEETTKRVPGFKARDEIIVDGRCVVCGAGWTRTTREDRDPNNLHGLRDRPPLERIGMIHDAEKHRQAGVPAWGLWR